MKRIVTAAALVTLTLLASPRASLAGKHEDAFAAQAREQHEARRAEEEERQERRERQQELQRQHEIDSPAVLDDEPVDEPDE